jgi:hypothetical protein
MGGYSLQLLLSPQIEDSDEVGLAPNGKLEAIGMESAAKNGICLFYLVNPFSCPQIPHHSISTQISSEVERLIGMQRCSMNFLLMASLT